MTNLIKANTYGKHRVELEFHFDGYNETYTASVSEIFNNEVIGDYLIERKRYSAKDLKKANARFNAYCRDFKKN